jgi:threonine/homoserine/homoserine lactone efflux protein
LLTATGANVGIVCGIPALLGVSVGMGIMTFIVAFGLGGLILDNPEILQVLKWIGIAFLLCLSWKIASAGRTDAEAGAKPAGLLAAAAFQWINPKSWLVCASAAGTYLETGSGSAFSQALSLGAIFILGSLPSCFPWLAGAANALAVLALEDTAKFLEAHGVINTNLSSYTDGVNPNWARQAP